MVAERLSPPCEADKGEMKRGLGSSLIKVGKQFGETDWSCLKSLDFPPDRLYY